LERKAVSVTVLILLLPVGVLTLAFKTELVSAIIPEYPAIYVDPPVVKGTMPGNNVTVSIKTDYSGYDIWGWQFALSYNPSILNIGIDGLNYTDIWAGTGTKKSFEATGKLIVPDSEDVYVNDILMTKPDNYTIDYRTGWITFKTVPASGAQVKATYKYALRNGDLITTEKVPTAMFAPGTFNNTLGTLSSTWAVVDFFYMISPPPTTYGPGTLAYVTFTVVGYGFSNITLGPGTKLIGSEQEPPHIQYYIINAETMPDHIGHGYFSNILLGDADFNGLVEMPDFYIWRESFGEGEDRPFSIPDVDPDFNNDGIVDMYDFYIWREHFGESV